MASNFGYVKLNRSPQLLNLLETDHQAFVMLTWIAVRANRETGQAMIGDWQKMGVTSEATYRRIKNRIQAAGLATFKATNKGTLATLVNISIFDINQIESDEQSDEQTDEQTLKKPTSQPTTNKNFKELFIKEIKEYGVSEKSVKEWLKIRTAKRNQESALKKQAVYFQRLIDEGYEAQKIFDVLVENAWVGIKPTEAYFMTALTGGTKDVKDRLTDTSWAGVAASDKFTFRDLRSNLPRLDEKQKRTANSGR